MDWDAWRPWYDAIVQDLQLDPATDRAARDELAALLRQRPPPLDLLAGKLRGKSVTIVGAGHPVAPGDLLAPVVVADKAVAAFVAAGGTPDLIVTDLDGDVAKQVELNRGGVPVAVHAHGDNRPAVQRWVPRMEGPVLGTTQVEPVPPLVNAGGFTDGDRACFLAARFAARSVTLAGFDLEGGEGRKARKLQWAKRLLEALPVPVRTL